MNKRNTAIGIILLLIQIGIGYFMYQQWFAEKQRTYMTFLSDDNIHEIVLTQSADGNRIIIEAKENDRVMNRYTYRVKNISSLEVIVTWLNDQEGILSFFDLGHDYNVYVNCGNDDAFDEYV